VNKPNIISLPNLNQTNVNYMPGRYSPMWLSTHGPNENSPSLSREIPTSDEDSALSDVDPELDWNLSM